MHLCKERGVAINLIVFPILHVVGTPLLNAIRSSHEGLALELMDLPGQDLDLERHVGKRRGTVLHLATEVDSCVVVEMLLILGASLDALDDADCLAVFLAARRCRVSALRVLLREYQTRGRLEEALERSCRDSKGSYHPLLRACMNNLDIEEDMRLATTRLLIEEFNANVRTIRREGDVDMLPIHYAAAYGLLSIVKFYILECGLPVDTTPGKAAGMTPLHCAAACLGSTQEVATLIIEWLVEQGASLTIQNYGGFTAAQLATREGKTLVAGYLERRAKTAAIRAEEARQKAEDDLLAELEAEKAAARQGGGEKKKKTKKKGKGKDKGVGKVGGESRDNVADTLTAAVGGMSLGEGDRQK
jgi:ankyrin repeat protein